MTKKNWSIILGAGILMLAVAGGVLLGVDWSKYGMGVHEEYPNRGLPVLAIDLDGVELTEIDAGSKDIRYKGNRLDAYDRGVVLEYDNVEIKGRGNGTWVQNKKPYQIKFDKKVNLLGMGKAKKWYLLANYLDETNLRNEAALYMAGMLRMEYVMDGKFVELYVNSEYRGLYYLTHAMEVGKNSVDLKNSMGVLVELDNFYGGWEKYYTSGDGEMLVVKDVVAKGNEEVAMEGFLKSFDRLEMAVERKDYGAMSKLIDVESFAKYYLLSEFTVNPDAYLTSFYMYKDGDEDVIHAGPGWDFDVAFGNREWKNWLGEVFYSPTETMVRKREIFPEGYYDLSMVDDKNSRKLSKLVFQMMEVPEFEEIVKKVFRENLSGRWQELEVKIIQDAVQIRMAAEEDSAKWEKEDYDTGVKALLKWVEIRYQYLEGIYGDSMVSDNA